MTAFRESWNCLSLFASANKAEFFVVASLNACLYDLDAGAVFQKGVLSERKFLNSTPIALSKEIQQNNKRETMADEFKMVRENNVDGQARLTVVLPQAEGKQRFLRLISQR